ncbi:MAG: hypothetical protein IJC93_06235 [Clostridia bacterium]|nr:hypothetical protein [Clostridia bacterium]
MRYFQICAPLQKAFLVRTDCPATIDALTLKFQRYVSEVNERPPENCEDCTEDPLLTSAESADEFLARLDQLIFERNSYDDTVLAFHGAAVAWQKKAYLFLASTTSGKTTLAAYLAANGFDYITDDCILLNRTDFSVTPFPTPIHLRHGGMEVLTRYGAQPTHYTQVADRYLYTPQNCVAEPLPLGAIFFIRRTESENKVVELPANAQMIELMKSPITTYPITVEYLQLLSRLTKTNCRQLIYSDMAFVAEVIRHG